jgi:hypothetical protein
MHGGLAEYVGAPPYRVLFSIACAGMRFSKARWSSPSQRRPRAQTMSRVGAASLSHLRRRSLLGMLCAFVARHFGAARLAVVDAIRTI